MVVQAQDGAKLETLLQYVKLNALLNVHTVNITATWEPIQLDVKYSQHVLQMVSTVNFILKISEYLLCI